MEISFELNGEHIDLEADGAMSLLWVLRDILDLKGAKYGCGKAACGACTLIIDGEAVRSCVFPVRNVAGRQVTTIEGLSREGKMHPVQQAWLDEIVIQCGYCQPGFIMATIALLDKIPNPSDKDIDRNILNVCRCGTYYRMRKAIHRAASANRPAVENEQHE